MISSAILFQNVMYDAKAHKLSLTFLTHSTRLILINSRLHFIEQIAMLCIDLQNMHRSTTYNQRHVHLYIIKASLKIKSWNEGNIYVEIIKTVKSSL